MKRILGLLFLSVIAVAVSSLNLFAETYSLDPAKKGDSVYFRSNAKLEFVEGVTTDVVGGFQFDPTSKSDSVSGVIRVDLRTLETGIKMRDQHMRDNHLETGKFPHAYFVLTSLSGVPGEWKADSSYQLTATGEFYIHGAKRKLTAQIQASSGLSGEHQSITARATFSINLDAFKIPRPKALLLKLAESMNVEVIFKGYSGLEKSEIALPNWPELP